MNYPGNTNVCIYIREKRTADDIIEMPPYNYVAVDSSSPRPCSVPIPFPERRERKNRSAECVESCSCFVSPSAIGRNALQRGEEISRGIAGAAYKRTDSACLLALYLL